MEDRRGRATFYKRIQWTRPLERELIEVASEAEHDRRGYWKRLEELWLSRHPTLPSRGSALAEKRLRILSTAPVAMEVPEAELAEPHAADQSEPEVDVDVDMEVEETGSPPPSQRIDSERELVKGIVCASWEDQKQQGYGSLGERRRHGKKLTWSNPELVGWVDEILMELWEAEEDKSLWRLNCLMYAGADAATTTSRGGKLALGSRDQEEVTQASETMELESLEQDSRDVAELELEGDPWEGLPQPGETLTKEHPKQVSQKPSTAELQKILSWICTEIQRREHPRGRPTRRDGERLKKLRQRFGRLLGRGSPDLRKLRALRENQRAILRIRFLQIRKEKRREARRKLAESVRVSGPSVLGRDGGSRVQLTSDQLREVEVFWRGVWEVEGSQELDHPVLREWAEITKAKGRRNPDDEPYDKEAAWGKALSRVPSWRAPGPDCVEGFWLKKFVRTTAELKGVMWEVLEGRREMPAWIVRGRTVMIPKDGCRGEPDKFRPITCLNTTYKLLTSMFTVVLAEHVEQRGLLPPEQKALRRGRRGCLDALTVDGAVATETLLWKRDLSVGWIDYRKAYDMTPHRWIPKVLRAVGAPRKIRKAIEKLITHWKTDINVHTADGVAKIPITLRRGLFQGDSLSPLLFCLCVAPLSHELRKGTGFRSEFHRHPVTHLMFMDDLKVYEQSKCALEATLTKVEEVSEALGMSLGLKKCAVVHVRAGTVEEEGPLELRRSQISEIEEGGSYRYLGVSQLVTANSRHTKSTVETKYLKRVKQTWGADMSSHEKRKAHNTWATAVCTYYFGAVRWERSDLQKLDRKTRKVLRQTKSHYLNAALERLYLPWEEGGRGIRNLEHAWEREVVAVAEYLRASEDEQVKGAVRLQMKLFRGRKKCLIAQEMEILARHGVERPETPDGPGGVGKKLVAEVRKSQIEAMVTRLCGKKIHGVFANQVRKPETDWRSTHMWLKEGKMTSQTQAFLIAAQDGILRTRAYRARVLKEAVDPTCSACEKADETLGHILSACPSNEWTLYKTRHDRVLYKLADAVFGALGLSMPGGLKRAEGGIKRGVAGTRDKRVLVDMIVPTNRTISERRPDLLVRLEAEKLMVIMEVACAWEPIVVERECEKKRKYQALAADLATQYEGYRVRVVPVVVGDMGLVCNLKKQLAKAGLMPKETIEKLVAAIQTEAMYGSVQLLKRHLAADC